MVVLEREHEVLAGVESSTLELLFKEAKQRRRRRWLTTGAVAVALILLLGIVLAGVAGGGGPAGRPTGDQKPRPLGLAGLSAAAFSIRPILCYAPNFNSAGPVYSNPLPACRTQSQLSAANLDITLTQSSPVGYTFSNVTSDPAFATYPSTTARNSTAAATVLLPGSGHLATFRFVLGPAPLTRLDVKSATVVPPAGWRSVRISFTDRGSLALDNFAYRQFHELAAVVVNNRVVYTLSVQPAQPAFTSLQGVLTFGASAGLATKEAQRIAASL
jgi:hypothetical protein